MTREAKCLALFGLLPASALGEIARRQRDLMLASREVGAARTRRGNVRFEGDDAAETLAKDEFNAALYDALAPMLPPFP